MSLPLHGKSTGAPTSVHATNSTLDDAAVMTPPSSRRGCVSHQHWWWCCCCSAALPWKH